MRCGRGYSQVSDGIFTEGFTRFYMGGFLLKKKWIRPIKYIHLHIFCTGNPRPNVNHITKVPNRWKILRSHEMRDNTELL